VIVVDASALIEVLLNTPVASIVSARIFDEGETLHAPHLVDVEVGQVIRRYALAGALTADRGRQALEDLAAVPMTRYPHDLFLSRIWQMRHSMTAFDAAYVALAEALEAPLVTRDARLGATARRLVRVEVI
jgi:predicted nucleic acid-binding protein